MAQPRSRGSSLFTTLPSMAISPHEEVTFLRRLVRSELPVSPRAVDMTAQLLKLPSNDERARMVFAEALGRAPDDAELAGAVAFLDARNDRPEAGVREMTWALLTSAEFLLNH